MDTERVRGACDPAASADLAVLLITVSKGVGRFWMEHVFGGGSTSGLAVQLSTVSKGVVGWHGC